MSNTPAALMARLRDVYGERWRIESSEPGQDMTRLYIAAERSTGRKLAATSLAQLEQQLIRAEGPERG